MTSTSVRIAGLSAAVAVALTLAACGSGQTPVTGEGEAGHAGQGLTDQDPVITGEPAGFNADDMAFANQMVNHHRRAIELAGLVPDRTSDPEVVAFAEHVRAAQQPEIDTLKVLLVQWKEGSGAQPGQDEHGGGHGGTAMPGMVDDATMTRLESLDGTEFDTLWLRSMIDHHRGAIEMANAELANGANVDAKQLAQNIVTVQQAEIDQLNAMLGAG